MTPIEPHVKSGRVNKYRTRAGWLANQYWLTNDPKKRAHIIQRMDDIPYDRCPDESLQASAERVHSTTINYLGEYRGLGVWESWPAGPYEDGPLFETRQLEKGWRGKEWDEIFNFTLHRVFEGIYWTLSYCEGDISLEAVKRA